MQDEQLWYGATMEFEAGKVYPEELAKTPLEDEWEKADVSLQLDRKFVTSHLYHSGKHREFLKESEYIHAFLLCDGFGDLRQGGLGTVGYDWSHVRDSSPKAIKECAEYIRRCYMARRISNGILY